MEENNSCPITCGCVGYAFVPEQTLNAIYDNAAVALCKGTIFPQLDLSINEYGCVCKEKGGVS